MRTSRVVVLALVVAALTSGAALAAGSPPRQASFTSVVTADPSTDVMEPAIAVNPVDPQNIIVTYNMSWGQHFTHAPTVPTVRQAVAPIQLCGFAVSRDGGQTWTRRYTPTVDAPVRDPVMTNCSDQLVLFDHRGTAFLVSSAYNPVFAADEDRMIVSHDEGATWSAPVTMAGTTFSAGRSPLGNPWLASFDVDRMWLAIDDATGDLYLDGSGWWIDTAAVIHNVVWMTSSSDEGQTWSPQTIVNGPVPTATTQNNPAVAAAFGEASVAYVPPSTALAAPTCTCVELAVTSNGARTFAHVKTPFRSTTDPLIAASPISPHTLAVLVTPPDSSDMAVYVTHDNGVTWSGPTALPDPRNTTPSHQAIAYSPAGVLGVEWRSYYGDGSFDAWGAASTDGGKTFGPPTRLDSARSPGPPPPYVAGDDTGTVAMTSTRFLGSWTDWAAPGAKILWGGFSLVP